MYIAYGYICLSLVWTPPFWPDITFAPSKDWPTIGISDRLQKCKKLIIDEYNASAFWLYDTSTNPKKRYFTSKLFV